jgi:amino acid adenylation domain-containing protein
MTIDLARTPNLSPVDGGLLRQQAEYWQATLADAPEPLEVPADRPRAAQPDHAGAVVRLELDEEVTAGLRSLGSRHGATLSTTLLAGWAAVVGRLSGQTDLVIGCFGNLLPVRVDLSGSPTAAELLDRVQARVQGALRNQGLPLERVVELVQPDGADASATPLFRVAFAWGDAPEPHSTAGLDLSLELREEEGGVAGEVVFATALFDRETVERYTRYLRRMLAGMAADETRPVDRLTLLSDEERRRVTEEWNRTEAAYPESYIHERFEAQAERTPDAVAVVYEDRELTYGELNARANRLAHHLRGLGVGPDVRVGICVERGFELVVAVFGVLKSGGAYLPLDPGYPQERLLDMVQDSAPVVLLTQEALAGRLAGLDVPLVALDEDAAWWASQPATDPERAALTRESLTYVIYTSGSTGRPKGVMMTHRGASNLLHWYLGATRITERDSVLIVTSFSFHLTQRNLMAPLFVGGRVHLAREPFEPGRIAAQIVASGITMMNLTPTGFQALVEADGGRAIGGLRIVVFGGEPLYPRQLARVPEPRPVFLNPYGSTEATGITAHHFARADLGSYTSRSMPPGRPIANASIYVLDQAGEPVPVGVTGELYLGGAGVTRGYRGRPGHTAERYLPDPFGATPGARLYRTGDLGRWLPDGTIEFMGRGDAQVKVRGFRIELGEIEARLAEHAAVHEVVVVARDGEVGDPRLVAYYTGDGAGAAALRAHLAERLPEYMVPAAFVHMDALPVNPNGKLDRKALPAPELASDEESYVAPRTPVEEVLAGIWAEVLGLERVGVEESFFDRGGHSLLATRVVSRVREVFGVELPLRALFEGPTVAEMAGRVEEMRRAGLPVLPPVVPVQRTEPPLSFAQERLWFLDQLRPGEISYNLPFALRLRGALDVDALERALGEIVRRHEALRTVFQERGGTPVQVIAPFSGLPLPVTDLSHLPHETREAEVQRELVEESGARGFNLAAGPLFRASLLRLGAREHVLLLSQHHIVSDGWSMGVLYRELASLYEAYRQGGESPLPELPVQYADYAVWQREQVEGEVLDRQLAYWRERLAGAPELLELPTDRPRPPVQTYRGGTVPVELSAELLERLQALGRSEGATLYMVLLGTFQVLLSRYSGSDDIVVGSPIAGRTRAEVEELIGFFVNTVVLRTDLSGDPSFREVLRRAREVTLGAYEHQEVPFERLVAELQPERSLSHTPLFQVILTLQTAGGGINALPGLEVSAVEAERVSAKFDLSLALTPTSSGLRGGLTYPTDLFERGTVERMLGHLERVLEQVTVDADLRLSELELLGPAERTLVLEEWSRTEAEYPADRCIHELFEAQAARTPGAIAAAYQGEALSYAELNARANQLAHSLRRRGVGPEVRVGICLERSLEMVVGILAILKAGGAYVPLDPAYPADRLAFILADSATPVLLTREALRAVLPAREGVEVVSLDGAAEEIAAESKDNPQSGAGPDSLAYVIYTSGSTGAPKGALIEHRNVARLFSATDAWFGFGPDDVWTLFHSYAFDFSVWELWGALLYGGRVVVVPLDVSRDPEAFHALVQREGVTVLNQTPSAFRQFIRVDGERGGELALRNVIFGGEALEPASLREWVERRGAETPRLVNMYGITETTVHVTYRPLSREDVFGGSGSPIGRAIPDLRLYVLDAARRPVPVGVPGELYVGGAGVARGYLNRPELAEARFVDDPFAPGRLYRTGDRVRWMADGTLEYLGRLDEQVKIRGFRIELGEIEARLAEHAAVREVVVLAREDVPGDRRLVAYVAGAVEADALRAHVRQSLPEYMVPSAFVVLDRLPLTANGKVDRKALPAPDLASAEEKYVAPRTPVEEVLAGIWAEVLRLERAGVEESFFELGGHSLLATRVVSRIREVFGVELPLRALFEGPTVAELAVRVEEIRRADLPVLPAVVPAGRTGALPLSFAQERLWFIDRLEPGSALYNISVAWRLAGVLDVDALERALGEIVRRHEALRTVFAEVDGSPVQVVAPFGGFALPVEELSGGSEAERQAMAGRRAGEEARRAFDLSAGPLFRAGLLRGGEEDHVLLLSMHHIVSDGWSMGVLYRELSALYAAYQQGRTSPLPELPVQYGDHALWQREHLRDGVLEGELAYWRDRLADAPVLLELPTDHPRPAVQTYRGATVAAELPLELLERLQALARSEGATLYMTLLSAFQVLLSKYSGSEDIVVGSPIAGRTRAEVEDLIGVFVNTLVLRTGLGGDPGFREVLRRAREVTLGAYEHQEVPFERLVAELQPERSLSHSPLFQVMFALQNAVGHAAALPGLEVSGLGAELASAQFDLFLMLKPTAQGLRVRLNYSTDLFERGTVERMLGHLERVLEQVAADADVRLSRLELLGDAERARVLEEWNRTGAEYPAGECIHELIEAQAARTPDAVAVRFDEESLTYRQLNEEANRLAHYLRRRGVGPEVPVGVLVERSPALITAVLGVLKAGGAYVPLDPTYPAERLRYVLEDSGARVLVTGGGARAALAGEEVDGFAVVDLDAEAEAITGEPETPPASGVLPQNLAYVIHTSGSTGRPKGTGVPHRGLVSSTRARTTWYGADPEHFLLLSSIAFDSSVAGVFWTLCGGGALHLMRGEAQTEPAEVVRRMGERGITDLLCVPSYYAALLRFVREPLPSLARAIVAGEAATWDLAAQHRALLPHAELVNEYGPTEATVWSTAYRCPPGAAGAGAAVIPIGGPIPNARAFVVDGHGRPVPVGVPGELWVGGAGVTRGYLGRPGLTAERFVPDPFSGEAGARLYRTGDRVRWRADGAIDYLGRFDHQVKVRGFRIELGEIEAVLRRHESVADCVVAVREDVPGDRRLVAYVVGEARAEALRAHVRRSSPEYMVPSAFVLLDALPLMPNGKLDRKALPAPEYAAGADRYVAPRTPVEEVLAGIWAEVLRLERVGVEESFFDLGGHSLLATRVVSRVRELFGVELPLRALFEGPTVAEMAGRVEERRRAGLPVLPPVLPAGRTGALPLSLAQERLWFLDRLEPGSATYNIPVAWRLGGALDQAALERALGEIVRRHEALRTVFAEADGSPVQVVVPFGGFALPVEELSGLGEADREAAVRRRAGEEARRAFGLSEGPLFRAALLRLGADDHVLLLSMHHIVSDGWSMGVLFRELSSLYQAYREGGESPLPELAVQYADYAVWQRERLEGEVLDRQLSYWRERLAGAPELLELPTDRPRPAVQTHRGATVPVELSLELLDRLRALGRSEGATLYMTLLGAFQVLLSKYGGGEDIVVGSPIAGRTRREVEELIGFFVNTLVLRTDLSGDPSFRETLRRVREVTLGAYENQEVPFERLVAELQPERSLSHAPLFQVAFMLQDAQDPASTLAELSTERVDAGFATAKADLSLTFAATPGGLRCGLSYATDLFERGTIVRLLGHLERVLEQVAANADVRLSRLELLGEAERALVLEEWNRTEAEVPAGLCIHELFEVQAARTPGAVAVVGGGAQLTYAELDTRANQLAHYLRGLGVGPEVRVGLCVERGLELVVCLLGVLKAGGAYVPLDPAYPADRLAFMLQDAAAPVLLTDSSVEQRLPAHGARVVLLDVEGSVIAREPAHAPESGVAAQNLAYVIYTSGSTGMPKGVLVPHRGLPNVAETQRRLFGLRTDERVLQIASFGFDAAFWDVLAALANGGTLCLATGDAALPGPELLRFMREHRITFATLQPTTLAVLAPEELPDLRTLVATGDVCTAEVVARWAPGRRFFNGYGPTETTIGATLGECFAGGGTPSIGRPFTNLRVYVLGPHGDPAPVGVAGELHVGGVGVVRGYLGRPELTAAQFVPDPFSGEAGARLYRTGDRGRWTVSGELEFLGRVDAQVKIRGYRVEPGEVARVLAAHSGVRDAAVVVREETGRKRLVAYWVGADEVRVEDLRTHLLERLPEFMVPAAYVRLDALPLTPNGKLDRRALPEPEESAYVRRGGEAPVGEVEAALAEIWGEVLGVERVGRWDHFFELGGHSLLAITLIERMRRRGLHTDVRALFTTPVLAELALAVGRASQEVEVPANRIPEGCESLTPEMLPLVELAQAEIDRIVAGVPGGAANVQDIYPLAALQEGILFHHLLSREGDPYLLSSVTEFDTRARLERYLGALQAVIDRHDVLRTALAWEGLREPVQVVWRHAPLPVEEVRLDGEAEDAAGQLWARYDPRHYRMDLGRAPLRRACIAEDRASGRWLLLMLTHHLTGDHESLEVEREEISAHLQGRESELPAPLAFRGYVAQARLGVSREEHERFFRGMLGDVEEPTAPYGLLDVRGEGRGIGEARLPVAADLAARLRRRARALGVSAASLCHLAWAQVLARLSGRADVVFGTLLFGRMQGGEGADRVMGPFINTLPVRIGVGDEGVEAAVRRTHALLSDLLRHEHASLALAQRCSGVAAPAPLFTSLLNYRYSGATRRSHQAGQPGEGVRGVRAQERTNYPVALSVDDLGEAFSLSAQVAAPADAERVCRMMHTALERLVQALEVAPGRATGSIDVLPEAERRVVVEEWNRTDAEYPRDVCVHELFQAQVARAPGAVAVVHEDRSLTYAELNARANRLAHHLAGLGVGPDARVAICVEPGPEMVVGMLAILKAGGAYVPVDPSYPDERLLHMLADSRPAVLLASSYWAERFAAAGVPVLDPADAAAWVHRPGTDPRPAGLSADHLCYVIYTSGSTGRPKGVAVPHRGVASLLADAQRRAPLREGDGCSVWTSASFDVSAWEIFSALIAGGRLCIPPDEARREAGAFLDWMEARDVRAAYLPPHFLPELRDRVSALPGRTRLHRLLVGVEPIAEPLLAEIRRSVPGLRVINGYGPTETTICATLYDVPGTARGQRVTPIGPPAANMRVFALDARMRPVPIGVAGELYVGGAGVARGYLDRPALTAERFVPDPLSGVPGARLYRTGDRGRWLAEGALEFAGRADFQVKVRGFRIEPGEIEARLREHPAVREAVVLAREDAPGDTRLVAYVVADERAGAEVLRAHLGQALPAYMVPAAFVRLETLPLTPNGKIDRKALPAPEGEAFAVREYETPVGEIEEALAEIWAELLGVERVGRHDDFFALGGHSLLAVQVVSRVRRVMEVELELGAVFERSALSALAERILDLKLVRFDPETLARLALLVRGPGAESAPAPELPV